MHLATKDIHFHTIRERPLGLLWVKFPFSIKLTHWEFYPFSVIYFPIFFYYIYLCIKARSFFFFYASNPCIENGGYAMESKYAISKILPNAYQPKIIFLGREYSLEFIQNSISKNKMQFPLYLKPDIGGKGKGVKKVNDITQIIEHIKAYDVDFVLQECINYDQEAGFFYVKFPNEKYGKLTGINLKQNLFVLGNGINTLNELILMNKRAILLYDELVVLYKNKLDVVLYENEKLELMPYGNHARGAAFLDYSFKINDKLNTMFNKLASKIDNFYFGRFDIKFNTWEDLECERNFSIVELNGAGSEPTHIYDTKNSIFFAWKEIVKHLNYLYKVSKENKIRGYKYGTIKQGFSLLMQEKKYNKMFS